MQILQQLTIGMLLDIEHSLERYFMKFITKINKPYTDIQRADFIVENNHLKGYEIKETETALEAWGMDEKDLLEQAKITKTQNNDLLRDEALNSGVVYKEVLFDSDTDQKVNLLTMVSTMQDTDTIEWFGMNNYSLICTKQDLLNIGGLITQLHSFCWTKNAEIKEQIKEAKTIEEVENIEVNYEN